MNLTNFFPLFYICLSWGCAVYGTQELTIFIHSFLGSCDAWDTGSQHLEVSSKLNRLFRPARPDQSYLAVLTTGLRWNGGRYAALPGPIGQHVVVRGIRTLIVAQS